VYTDPVVSDDDLDARVRPVDVAQDAHRRACGVGVARRVGQRFLDDPVRRELDGRRRIAQVVGDQLDLEPTDTDPIDQRSEVGSRGARSARRLTVAQQVEGGAQLLERVATGRLDVRQRLAGLLGIVIDEVQRDR
jgi:hypothetical protein